MVRNVSRLHLTECYTLCNGCGVQTERTPEAWERLREAWERSGLTLGQLRDRAGLKLSRPSICRKLGGKQALLADEEKAFARALGLDEAA